MTITGNTQLKNSPKNTSTPLYFDQRWKNLHIRDKDQTYRNKANNQDLTNNRQRSGRWSRKLRRDRGEDLLIQLQENHLLGILKQVF